MSVSDIKDRICVLMPPSKMAHVPSRSASSCFDLYDRLMADGIEYIVTPPQLIPTQSGNRIKADKKDRLKLAKLVEICLYASR